MRPASNINFVAIPSARALNDRSVRSFEAMIENEETPPVLRASCAAILASISIIANKKQVSKKAADEALRHIRSQEIEPWAYDHVLAALLLSGNFYHASRAVCMLSGIDAWVDFYAVTSNKNLPSTVIEFYFESSGRIIIYIQSAIFELPSVFDEMRRIIQILPLFSNYSHLKNPNSNYALVDLSDFGFEGALSFSGANLDNLIPDSFYLNDRGYASMKADYNKNWIKWKDRRDVFFWRGSTTGMSENWYELPRVKICQWARDKNCNKFDIKIVDIVQRSEADTFEILQDKITGSHIPASKFIEYKYHIDIDGNTNSWPGLFLKLITGSPVIKVNSAMGYKQWYYDKLIPWHNYVPVSSDLSDIDIVIERLQQDPANAENIGLNGRELALGLSFCNELDRALLAIERNATQFSSLAL